MACLTNGEMIYSHELCCTGGTVQQCGTLTEMSDNSVENIFKFIKVISQ